MPTAEEIKQRIEAFIPQATAEVEDYTGGGDHFRATVTSPAFSGRTRIEQHKLVYSVFGDEIGAAIHALSLKTRTHPEQTAAESASHDSTSAPAGDSRRPAQAAI